MSAFFRSMCVMLSAASDHEFEKKKPLETLLQTKTLDGFSVLEWNSSP